MNDGAMRVCFYMALSTIAACGGSTSRSEPGDNGVQDAAPGPPPAPGSASLRVGVALEAVGASADDATVFFALEVVDAASGAPVVDAAVRGGLAGETIPLVADPSHPGSYGGQRTGYSRAWEFVIARGGEPTWDTTLEGPSFPVAACVIDRYANPPVLTVDWAPANEPGVTSSVTVTQVFPAPAPYQPPGWTVQGHDEGAASFRIATSFADRYAIRVGVATNGSFDWGQATFGVASEIATEACR